MDKMEKPAKHVSFHGRFTSIVGVLQATGVQFFSKLLEDLSPGSAHHQPNEVMTPTKNPPPTHPKLNRLFLLVRRGIDRKIEHCFLFIVVQRPKIWYSDGHIAKAFWFCGLLVVSKIIQVVV